MSREITTKEKVKKAVNILKHEHRLALMEICSLGVVDDMSVDRIEKALDILVKTLVEILKSQPKPKYTDAYTEQIRWERDMLLAQIEHKKLTVDLTSDSVVNDTEAHRLGDNKAKVNLVNDKKGAKSKVRKCDDLCPESTESKEHNNCCLECDEGSQYDCLEYCPFAEAIKSEGSGNCPYHVDTDILI
jgi:hypothetical protein